MLSTAKKILKEIFGYDNFRLLQEEVINSALQKKDTLVIMPTGGGKSLCYQIPALILDGLTIVVSPLISLMKDQVEQLHQLGINAVLLNSSLTKDQYRKNYDEVASGSAKLLYIAPESLFKEDITSLISSIKVSCFTIDEAHCISEWGHDFRPEYRKLILIKEKLPDACCIALTATATPRVQDDIMASLKFVKGNKFVASFNRENLLIRVERKIDSFVQTLDFLGRHKNESGIIYCFSRRQVDELSLMLNGVGIHSRPYHAGLDDVTRSKNQEQFINDDVQIIVATIAFGMGINKSNVRFVLHYDLPKNLESYYQEIGRSGRDGLEAECLLLFSYGDIQKINYLIAQKEDEKERYIAAMHLNEMVKYAETELCRRIPLITYFGEKYDEEFCGMCDSCLSSAKEYHDVTVAAQKFFSCIKRTGEIFGANYIIDILHGSASQKILSNNHHMLTTYNIGKEYTKKQWQHLARQFVYKGFLSQSPEFGSLKLTELANEVLFKNKKVVATLPDEKPVEAVVAETEKKYDISLFNLLREKRKEVADLHKVPPYVIFSDKTLAEMATYFPQSEQGMIRISGVGTVKYENFGKIFVSVIHRYCKSRNIKEILKNRNLDIKVTRPNTGKKLRYQLVGEAYNSGKSVPVLIKEYNVKMSTILNHLYRFAVEGNELKRNDFIYLSKLTEGTQQKVIKSFEKLGAHSLGIVYSDLLEEVDYEELSILRLCYLQKNNKIKNRKT